MSRLAEFKNAILEKYDSESAFARDMEWPRQKVNHFTTGVRTPDLNDAYKMADKLDVPIEKMICFFIPTE